MFGVGAYYQPKATDLLTELPHTSNIDLSQRVLFSRDAAHFASDDPDIRDFHLTDQAALAGHLRRQLGAAVLPALERRPARRRAARGQELPDPGRRLPGPAGGPGDAAVLVGGLPRRSARPATRSASTTRASRTRHARARSPTCASSRARCSRARRTSPSSTSRPASSPTPPRPARAPSRSCATTGRRCGPSSWSRPATATTTPPRTRASRSSASRRTSFATSRQVTLPGYNHLDVATASWHQNDGRPEPTSKALANFAINVAR